MLAVAHLVTNHDELWAALIAGSVAIFLANLRGRQIKRTLGEPNGSGTIANMILNVHDEARSAREEGVAAATAAATAAKAAADAVCDHTTRDEARFAEVDGRLDETAAEIASLRSDMRDGFASLGQIIDSALGLKPRP